MTRAPGPPTAPGPPGAPRAARTSLTVLGIETSCDDTAVGVVRGRQVLSNVTSAQPVHWEYGGVVPELASRAHLELLLPALDAALAQARADWAAVDGIAVTRGPGLVGSLIVGVSTARALALAHGKDWLGVNHLEGHVWSVWGTDPGWAAPCVCLVASGGHTELLHVLGFGRYRLLGSTRDDAAGEAFDKAAQLLDLPYPGGPEVDRLARQGDPRAVNLPRALLREPGFEMSFSGLKTALRLFLERNPGLSAQGRADLAASFEAAVVDVLTAKTLAAAAHAGAPRIAVTGGVSLNTGLREAFARRAAAQGLQLAFPPPALCGDNGAMIALAGAERLAAGERSGDATSVEPSLDEMGFFEPV
ncbi:MAG TPA: tRNA (adenosine(37)-N6)-threonylcarbamoyltransferase complex transferase subunit TsaD [Candidatus Saccharimonadales bacterium]|nr:tRNA (adenosine(37)-N6)-threonylcarbamoyltransferase complex transferase subunit TsaD [Candidatus Saccharimonadales bacterium]